jgi:hypothetical protein
MTTIINGSSPSITFSDSTTQASAGLSAASPTISSGVLTFADSTTQSSAGLTSATGLTKANPTISSGVLTFPDATTQSSSSGVAKAWVCFTASSGTILNSYNVSSVTRNGTGDYTANFTTALTSSNYVVAGSSVGATSNFLNVICGNANSTLSASSCRFGSYNVGGSAQDSGGPLGVVFFR